MNNKQLKQFCNLDDQSILLLKQAISKLNLSARAFHRVIKIARTIADLEGSTQIKSNHVAEALQYRPSSTE
ncbi:MAG: Mg chelatase family protein [Microgenomates group bacterium GW2011_GWC1_40_35]|nr:MAG: Mg chelatase family protein [Microgenomates group bacterium GW2011_GWC1_40_35]